MRKTALALLTALLVIPGGAYATDAAGSVGAHDTTTSSRSPSTPEFVAAACPASVAAVPGIRCGRLIVPERRSKRTPRRVQLFVTRLPSRIQPAAEPVVVLQGGPGDTPDLASFVDHRLRDGHEVIILDQRGTGRSLPSLACPELSNESIAQLGKDPRAKASSVAFVNAARACRIRLVKAKVDLGAYNTRENAADVADLRRALHIAEWDLVGNSYGSRLALTVLRDHPQGVRALGLNGVYPPNENSLTDIARTTANAFDVLFAPHPGLREKFVALVRRLERQPVQATATLNGAPLPILFDGDNVVTMVRAALYQTSLIPLLPVLIEQLAAGQGFAAVAQLVADEAPRTLGAANVSFGAYYSTECQEVIPRVDRAALRRATRRYPSLDAVTPLVLPYEEICKVWGVKEAPAATRAPVRSSVPVLMFTGQLDPITPPFWLARATRTLSHGYAFVLPGYGHDATTRSCPREVRNQFFADPNRRPDDPCLQQPPG
jgi:pimeloyl-ACP methyl ester carboxylesterase